MLYISACMLMSTRLRTCSPTLLHGGVETDGEHALSHESPSVVLMRALAWLPACLNSIPACGRAQRARSHICASPCVTDRGRAAADDDGVGLKTTLQESHGGKFGRHVEKGRSSVHGCHVALASAGLGLSRLRHQSSAARVGDNISMAAEMEPTE